MLRSKSISWCPSVCRRSSAHVVVNVLDTGAGTDTMFRGLVQLIRGAARHLHDHRGRRRPGGSFVNAATDTPEPFNITTDGQPTRIELTVTGVRFATPAEITVTVGTTAISGNRNCASRTQHRICMGLTSSNFTLPASLAGAGDVPIQVQFVRGNLTTVSRPAGDRAANHDQLTGSTDNKILSQEVRQSASLDYLAIW